jgi:hypothetical protein
MPRILKEGASMGSLSQGFWAGGLLVVGAGLLGLPASAQPAEVFSIVAAPQRVNVDLRTLPIVEPWQEGDPEYLRAQHYEDVEPRFTGEIDLRLDGPFFDPVRQGPYLAAPEGGGGAAIQVGVNQQAFVFNGVHPPDVVGDVGLNHYIAMINLSLVNIYDKQGGLIVGPIALDSLWTAGGPCSNGSGDPIVLFDELANRWMLSEFAGSGNHLCLYISQGPNPVTDGWFLYDFTTPNFPDYPKYGVWPDAYYVSTFEGGDMGAYALDRPSMLSGSPATLVRFPLDGLNPLPGVRFTRLLPADHDGATAPLASTPGMFLRTVEQGQDSANQTDRIEIYEFVPDFATPANSTFGLVQTLTPASFALVPCSPGTRDCIEQPDTAVKIDALTNRAMRRLQYRNFGSHEMLLVNQAVDAGAGVSGIRWYEMRRPVMEGAGWSIFQQGTYAPDSDSRWMGGIGMNGNGDIAIGYSVSSTATYPSIRVAGRRAGDTAGLMTVPETEIATGTNPQTAAQRWGDYSALSVDPADDRTFWYIQEYMPASRWQVQFASFQINDEVFSDGFEGGNFLAWSAVVP